MRPSFPGKIGPFSLRKVNSAVSLGLGQSFSASDEPYCGAAMEGALVDGSYDSRFPEKGARVPAGEVCSKLCVEGVDVLVSCLCGGLLLGLSVCLNASTHCFD